MKLSAPARGFAVALALTAAITGLAAPAAAETETAAACNLYAFPPQYFGNSIGGYGGVYNCPSSVHVEVVLRQDRPWWPDRTLDTATDTGTYAELYVSEPCDNTLFNPMKVFVETRAGGEKVQSPRRILMCA